MHTVKDGNAIAAFGYSLALTSVLSVILVIVKEKSEAVMAVMKAMTGHHWITHGLIVLALFTVIGLVLTKFMPARPAAPDFNSTAAAILAATVVSGLALAAFYVLGG